MEVSNENNKINMEEYKNTIINNLTFMLENFNTIDKELYNVKNDNSNIKNKLDESEENMKNFNKVSLLKKMSDQINEKNRNIEMLERKIKMLNEKLENQKKNNSNKPKDANNDSDCDNYELITNFDKITIKNKEYLLDKSNDKIFELNNLTECIGKLYINSNGEKQLRKKKNKN